MTTFRRSILIPGIACALVAAIPAPPQAAPGAGAAAQSALLGNLQAAYNGETNTQARYTAFAAQADKEGFPAIASLFRAAAQAEGVHAGNFAIMIKQMGVKPASTPETPVVKTTAENLKAAIDGETRERDTTYPGYAKAGREANIGIVDKTFTSTLKAEAEHAKLFAADLKQLKALKGAPARSYTLCHGCGFLTVKKGLKTCPTCEAKADKLQQAG
jgi:rubrerythrin